MYGIKIILAKPSCGGSYACMNSGSFSLPYFRQMSFLRTPEKNVGLLSLFVPFEEKKDLWVVHMGMRADSKLLRSCMQNMQYMAHSKSDTISANGSPLLKNILQSRCTSFPFSSSLLFSQNRGYSSYNGKKPSDLDSANGVPSVPGPAGSADVKSDVSGTEWLDVWNNFRRAAVDSAISMGNKVKEISDESIPYIRQLYESHPYLETVAVPVASILSANIAAWVFLPRILRRLHKYTTRSPISILSGSPIREQVPYEKGLWCAVEEPVRYLITFLAFSQLAVLIVPSTSPYLSQSWRGATAVAFVWFLYRWKTIFFTRAIANEITVGLDRDKLLTLERLSTIGVLILGAMSLAEASGVAVNSILTVGGIGGVATAFASRDILGNLLSGLSLQLSKPFSIGDNIKAGSIEGQVVDMGLTTTSLINSEKFSVVVPNSLFSSQVIVNKSRAKFRSIVFNFPLRIQDLEKVSVVSEEITAMLRSNPKVFMEAEAPYCFLSRLDASYVEMRLGCNLKTLKSLELYAVQQEIVVQTAKIIRRHGAELGSDLPPPYGQ